MTDHWASKPYKKYGLRIWGSFLLGLLGIAASIATIYAVPLDGASKLSCGFEKLNCATALQSQFSKVAGIPLGVFGVFYFTFWSLNLRAYQRTSNDAYLCSLSWITLLGAVVSSALAAIMFVLLQAPCLYCMITHICNVGAFVLLWPVRKWKMDMPFNAEQMWHFVALTGIALLGATTIMFADRTRHLSASLKIRNEILAAMTQSDSDAKLQSCSSLVDARADALQSGRLLCVGFFDPS